MKRKVTGTAKPIVVGLGIGVLASLVMTMVGVAVVANLVLSEKLAAEFVGYGATVILLVASAVGAWLAIKAVKRRRMLVCLGAGGSYYLILLAITALFFGGQYQGMGVTALLILGGCGAVGLLGITGENGKRKRPKNYRFSKLVQKGNGGK